MEAANLRDNTMDKQSERGDLSGGAWDLSSELKEDSGYLKKMDDKFVITYFQYYMHITSLYYLDIIHILLTNYFSLW